MVRVARVEVDRVKEVSSFVCLFVVFGGLVGWRLCEGVSAGVVGACGIVIKWLVDVSVTIEGLDGAADDTVVRSSYCHRLR